MSGSVNKKRVQSSLAWGQRSPLQFSWVPREGERSSLPCSDCWLLLSINRRFSVPAPALMSWETSLEPHLPGKFSVWVSRRCLQVGS